jgi:hypothetical protein
MSADHKPTGWIHGDAEIAALRARIAELEPDTEAWRMLEEMKTTVGSPAKDKVWLCWGPDGKSFSASNVPQAAVRSAYAAWKKEGK